MIRLSIPQLVVAAFFSALICSHACSEEWKMGTTVDEFGDDTGDRVVSRLFEAKMTNSATKDAKSAVRVLVYEETPVNLVVLEHLQYGRTPQDFDFDAKYGEKWRIKIKDDEGKVTLIPLQPLRGKVIGFSGLDTNETIIQMILSNNSLSCVAERVTSNYQNFTFKIESNGFREAMEPIYGEQIRQREAERAMAAKKAEEERLAMELKQEAEMQKEKVRQQLISTPMIFKTKDGKFSVNGLYLASNSTHVRLKRVDNDAEVTVELKLLSEDTVEQIKARK